MKDQKWLDFAISTQRCTSSGFACVLGHHVRKARIIFRRVQRTMANMGESLLAQRECLKALREVMSAKMDLSSDELEFTEDDLRALSVSCSWKSSAGSD